MHQSGHSRAQSMHEVQFSSVSAMTPREREGSAGDTSGYSAVWAWRVSERAVVAMPLTSPGRMPSAIASHPPSTSKGQNLPSHASRVATSGRLPPVEWPLAPLPRNGTAGPLDVAETTDCGHSTPKERQIVATRRGSCAHHHSDGREGELEKGDRHEPDPGQALELVLAHAGPRDPQPDDDDGDREALEQGPQPSEPGLERAGPPSEEEHGEEQRHHDDA